MPHRAARDRIDVAALVAEAGFLIEADGAGIVGIDGEPHAGRRKPLRLGRQRRRQPAAPVFGRDYQLVEVACAIDGDEAGKRRRVLGDDDLRARHQFVAPACPPTAR